MGRMRARPIARSKRNGSRKHFATSGWRADSGERRRLFWSVFNDVRGWGLLQLALSRSSPPNIKTVLSFTQHLSVPFHHFNSPRMPLQNKRLSNSKCDSNTDDES
jgi:hypothetical protein